MRTVFFLVFCALWVSGVQAAWYKDDQAIMGTQVSVELWADDSVLAQQAIAAAMAEMRRIDALMSPYKVASEVSRINRNAASRPQPLSAELYALIDKALFYSRISDGAFDISFAALGNRYQYRSGEMPSDRERSELQGQINYQRLKLDPERRTLSFLEAGMAIDLGGIAKGYAVDNAIQILQNRGIVAAVVSAGGDSRVLGDRGGRPWVIGIKHPRDSALQVVKIPLTDTALSTSGDYERFFIKDGVRYHHILDPKSGVSASLVQSVSILAPLAVDSDALSTTVFVLGVKPGLALVNRLPSIDAIIIDAQGRLHYSDGLLRPNK